MNAQALLDEVRARGIRLEAHGEALRYRAPRGALDEDLRRVLLDHKREILALLVEAEPPALTLPPRAGCPETAALVEAAGSAFVAYFNRWGKLSQQPWPPERGAELDALAAAINAADAALCRLGHPLERYGWTCGPSGVWARLSAEEDAAP